MVFIKKVIFLMITLTLSTAFAQGVYAGVSTGLDVAGGVSFNLDGYFGAEDLFAPDIGLRSDVGLLVGNSVAVKFAGEALFGFDADQGGPITIFIGAGPRLVVGSSVDFGLGLLGQFDYDLANSNLSVFGEVDLDIYFIGGVNLLPGLEVGLRFML